MSDGRHLWSPFEFTLSLCGFNWWLDRVTDESVSSLREMVGCERCLVEMDALMEIDHLAFDTNGRISETEMWLRPGVPTSPRALRPRPAPPHPTDRGRQ